MATVSSKPLLRGVSHQIAFFVSAVAGVALVHQARQGLAAISAAIYAASLAAMLGISALYHRINWPPDKRLVMKRLDHAGIFLLIAGSYTPICLLALAPGLGHPLLAAVWTAAALGIVKEVLWIHAPKAVTAIPYTLLGCAVVPFLSQVTAALGSVRTILLGLGGVLYLFGALAYARQRPNPIPGVFGYHEVFHALVVAAAVLHFVAIGQVVLGG